MGVSYSLGNDWKKTKKWMHDLHDFPSDDLLEKYGRMGVAALYEYTPKLTGKTAASWDFEIIRKAHSVELYWINTNLVWHTGPDGVPEKVSVAVLIQNGHATPRGNWVEARDFMTPALTPVIEALNKALDKEAVGR